MDNFLYDLSAFNVKVNGANRKNVYTYPVGNSLLIGEWFPNTTAYGTK